jgi:SHS2 domain-containing protein
MDGAPSDAGGALPQRTRRRRRRRADRDAPADAGSSCHSPTVAAADLLDAAHTCVRPVPAAPPGNGYEYLDHTADVQLHSWGTSLPLAFEQAVVAMMAYMTDLELVEVREQRTFTAEGHDLKSLLYNFMDECLYVFCTELHVCKQIEVEFLELVSVSPDDRQSSDGGSDTGGIEEQSGADVCERAKARRRHTPNGCDGDDAGGDTTSAAVGSERVWRIRARGVGERFEMGRHPQGTEVKAITYSAMQIFDRTHSTQAAACNGVGKAARAADDGAVGGGEHAAEIFVIVDI